MPERGNNNISLFKLGHLTAEYHIPSHTAHLNINMPTQLVSNANTNGFLSNDFPHGPPRLIVTAEDEDFDEVTLQELRDEGFAITYVPMLDGGPSYGQRLDNLPRTLGVGVTTAIISYGDAASYCLEHYLHSNAANKVCALIAYYPTSIPSTKNSRFPSGLRVEVHLAGHEIGVTNTQQVLGIQGKRRTVRKRIGSGKGTGGRLNLSYPAHMYEGVEPGFAEHDLEEYEAIASDLAFSRTLGVLRRAFRFDVELERIVEENVESKFFTANARKTISTITTKRTPHVINIPTLTGGIGIDELYHFYSEAFVDANPESLRLKLLSRTTGTDTVVDEIFVTFEHTKDMPWILPGVPATNKTVEIIVVSIVCVRGGRLFHERMYWDQASVLVQVGLLDPNMTPKAMEGKGVERLPVVGQEGARTTLRIAEGKRIRLNGLIPDWNHEKAQEKGRERRKEDEEYEGDEEDVGEEDEQKEEVDQDDSHGIEETPLEQNEGKNSVEPQVQDKEAEAEAKEKVEAQSDQERADNQPEKEETKQGQEETKQEQGEAIEQKDEPQEVKKTEEATKTPTGAEAEQDSRA